MLNKCYNNMATCFCKYNYRESKSIALHSPCLGTQLLTGERVYTVSVRDITFYKLVFVGLDGFYVKLVEV